MLLITKVIECFKLKFLHKAPLNRHMAVTLRLSCGITLNKFRPCSQRDLCWDFPCFIVSIYICFLSSFRCRESGQTSESIVGAALIPSPQAIFAALYVLTFQNIALKNLPCGCARVCVHTWFSTCLKFVLYVPVWDLSVLTSLSPCCKLQNSENNLVLMQDSYLDEKWQFPFEESADEILKRETVLILSQNTEAKQDKICEELTTASLFLQLRSSSETFAHVFHLKH